ncbi:MAG: prepilin-type N-terminal cleavage/methylation domain-containing protein [Nitrospirota bacterium]
MSFPGKTYHTLYLKDEGFTLIELLTVISVVGILVTVLAFSFDQWNSGYTVESQIKRLHMDLMNTRARSMQRSRMHFVDLTATQYDIYEDTDPAPDGDGIPNAATDTRVTQKILNLRYPIVFTNAQVEFNNKGISINDTVICNNAVADADYDCIDISATRINMGQLTTSIPDGGACDAANCVNR